MTLAEAFPVGEHLADELEARGWSQSDFAEVLGRPTQFVSEIITGRKEITRESAAQIAAALGTSAEFWLNLQDSYLLWRQAQDSTMSARLHDVQTRARLRELAPIALLRRRGVVTSSDLEEEVEQVLRLLGLNSLDDDVQLRFAARRANASAPVTSLQTTWVSCVETAASALQVSAYSPTKLRQLAQQLTTTTVSPEAFAGLQSLFAEVGVKLVYVEAFPGGRLDGCALSVGGIPVIGLSGRGKRLDKVLFTLLHEVAHLLLGHINTDDQVVLDDLAALDSESEQQADRLAAQLALPRGLPSPPVRINSAWVAAQAQALKVHPIVIVGRLQKAGLVSWQSSLARGAPTVTSYLQSWRGLSEALG